MSEPAPLTKPRYSLVDVTLLMVVAAGAIGLVAYARESSLKSSFQQYLLKVEAPPPNVKLAADVPKSMGVYKGKYQLTQDWFTSHVPSWSAALKRYAGKPGVEYLEVGVFEGAATVWMIENILTDPTSHITGLDIFTGDYVGEYGTYKDRYLHNIEAAGAAARSTTIQGFSQVELRKLPLDHYDIVYIDGSHLNADALEDAVLCFRMLKEGGVLIFDDYGEDLTEPKHGIDAFLKYFGDHYEVVHNDYQMILTKRVTPKAS